MALKLKIFGPFKSDNIFTVGASTTSTLLPGNNKNVISFFPLPFPLHLKKKEKGKENVKEKEKEKEKERE
jgi:hypothetical protein